MASPAEGAAGAAAGVGDGAWLRGLPKVELHVHLDGALVQGAVQELHVHLDGALDQALLYELAVERAEGLPEVVLSAVTGQRMPVRAAVCACKCQGDFTKLVTCKGRRSLKAMLDCFSIFMPVVQGRLAAWEEMAYLFCKRQAEQNVAYTEVRYSPHLLIGGEYFSESEPLDPVPALDAVTRGLRRGCAEHGIVVNQIVCCIAFRPEWSMECVELADRRRADFPCAVVGVDVAAGEVCDFPEGHAAALKRARELGLSITLHAGETGGPENVRRSVEEFGATRIGHGYAAAEEPELLRALAARGVHFEACPTSSLETGAWRGPEAEAAQWASHPVKAMLEAGASVSLNSDDPSVFVASLTGDMALCLSDVGLTREQLLQATLAAADACFAGGEEKAKVRELIESYGLSGAACEPSGP